MNAGQRPRPSRRRSRRGVRFRLTASETPALVAAGVLLIGAPLLFGGVFAWSVVAIAGVALAALILTLFAMRPEPALLTPWLMWAVCLAGVWTVVQVLPLPCTVAARLAPQSVSQLRGVLELAGAPAPSWCELSRDPGATQLEVLKGAAICTTFLTAWLLSVRLSRATVVALCAVSTLVMSVVAHAHMVLGLHEVYGVYRPLHAGTGLQLAPLMNPNNLGAFAALGVPLWLDIMLRRREPRIRWFAAVALVLTATTAVLSLSRGAIAMLVGSVALLVLLTLALRRGARDSTGRGGWVPQVVAGLALSAALAFAVYIAMDQLLEQLDLDVSGKLGVIGRAFAFAADHPWLGIGRGAFASAFASRGDRFYFTHAENFVAQWASEWGIPVTGVLLLAITGALWRSLRGWGARRRLGAIVAVVAFGMQNLFDVGLELVGVAVVAGALLAAAVAPSRARGRNEAAGKVSAHRFAVGVTLGAAGLLLWLGPSAERDDARSLEASLRAGIDGSDRRAFHKLLERAVRLHPTEPVFAVIAAGEALAHHDPAALRWCNYGMRLAPGWTAPHIQAFLWLWNKGHSAQALLELRAAAEISIFDVAKYVCPVANQSAGAVLSAAPVEDRSHRETFLELAAKCHPPQHPTTEAIDAALQREFPGHLAAKERGALRLAHAGDHDAALRELEAIQRRDPSRTEAGVLRAQMLFQAKRFREAAAVALKLAAASDSAVAAQLWTMRARALAEVGDDAGWAEAIVSLRRSLTGKASQLAETYALEGDLHMRRGQEGAALQSYRAGYSIKNDPKFLVRYASVANGLGDRSAAVWAYMRLCDLRPHEADYCARRDELMARHRRPGNLGARAVP